MDPTTRFDEDEIRRILAKAAERQEQAERALPSGLGPDRPDGSDTTRLTLADLQEAAQEVGIDPTHVQAAAREVQLHRERPKPRANALGIPRETASYRVWPGRLTEAQWDQVVGEFRSEFEVQGVTNSFGDVREWWSGGTASTGASVRFRLEPGEDGASVSLRRDNKTVIETTYGLGWTFAGLGGLLAGLAAFAPELPMGIALLVGAISGGTFLAGRILGRRGAQVMSERFERVLDRIELIARRDGSG